MKRHIIIAVALMAILAGCSTGSSGGSSPQENPSNQSMTTISQQDCVEGSPPTDTDVSNLLPSEIGEYSRTTELSSGGNYTGVYEYKNNSTMVSVKKHDSNEGAKSEGATGILQVVAVDGPYRYEVTRTNETLITKIPCISNEDIYYEYEEIEAEIQSVDVEVESGIATSVDFTIQGQVSGGDLTVTLVNETGEKVGVPITVTEEDLSNGVYSGNFGFVDSGSYTLTIMKGSPNFFFNTNSSRTIYTTTVEVDEND